MRAVGVACNGNDVIIVVVVATGDGVEGESWLVRRAVTLLGREEEEEDDAEDDIEEDLEAIGTLFFDGRFLGAITPPPALAPAPAPALHVLRSMGMGRRGAPPPPPPPTTPTPPPIPPTGVVGREMENWEAPLGPGESELAVGWARR